MKRMPFLQESRHRLLLLRHLLRENQPSRGILRWPLDLLLIPNYVFKKGRLHGHRCEKIEEQRQHCVVHHLRKRCIKRGFQGLHDRSKNDSIFRDSQLGIDRTEEVCIQMDKDAHKKISPIE